MEQLERWQQRGSVMKSYIITLIEFTPTNIVSESEYLRLEETFWKSLERKLCVFLLNREINFKLGKRFYNKLGIRLPEGAWTLLQRHPAVKQIQTTHGVKVTSND